MADHKTVNPSCCPDPGESPREAVFRTRGMVSQLRRLADMVLLSLSEIEGRVGRPESLTYRSIRSADGVTIERGDNCFLGSDPERRLVLIDAEEAMCAERMRIIGLPDGVPVFSRRDRARDWHRDHRRQSTSPGRAGAPASDRDRPDVGGAVSVAQAGPGAAAAPLFGGGA